jgi:hypothetical protein
MSAEFMRLGSARASRAVSGALAGKAFELENLTVLRCAFGEGARCCT